GQERRRGLGDLPTRLRVPLQDDAKDGRLSSRLTRSPACLVADEHDLSPRMQHMLEQLGHAAPRAKPILELNPEHAVTAKLEAIFRHDSADPRLAACAQVLLGQAHLADGGQVPRADAFSQALTELMLAATVTS